MKYFLRTRLNDQDEWGEPEEFQTRKERDKVAQQARCLFGIRVWRINESESARAPDARILKTDQGKTRGSATKGLL